MMSDVVNKLSLRLPLEEFVRLVCRPMYENSKQVLVNDLLTIGRSKYSRSDRKIGIVVDLSTTTCVFLNILFT